MATLGPGPWYVVLKIHDWSALEVTVPFLSVGPLPMGKVADGSPIGFLPAFTTREEAEAWADGKAAVITVELKAVA